MHKYTILLFVSLLLVTSAYAGEPMLLPLQPPTKRYAQEILVKFRTDIKTTTQIQSLGVINKLAVKRVAIPTQQTAQQAAAELSAQGDIAWAQPNYWRYALATEVVPDDPFYRPERNQRQYQQWHLPKINANFAWSISDGSDDLIVAVVDSGVDLNHPDLKDRLLLGVSIVNQDDYTPPANGMDDNGHGTHVAGIIGALTNMISGVSGCSWQGKILPIKVLNSKGEGTDADIAAGIIWAVDSGAHIINLSLGGTNEDNNPPQVLQDAIDYAYNQGRIVIAAAGNDGNTTPFFPAAMSRVLAIGATDPSDQRSSFSSYGAHIDLSAPGGAGEEEFNQQTGMLSTYWNDNSQISDMMSGSEAGEYAILAGTSMASALVSGAALVILSNQPNLTVDQMETVLKSTSVDIGLAGADEETGAGRLDLLAALGTVAVEQPVLTAYNYPNPFHPERDGSTQIVFLLDDPQNIELKIYDVSRDLVWSKNMTTTQTMSGKNTITWNGENSRGRAVANGVYYFRITSSNGQASKIKTIAVLR